MQYPPGYCYTDLYGASSKYRAALDVASIRLSYKQRPNVYASDHVFSPKTTSPKFRRDAYHAIISPRLIEEELHCLGNVPLSASNKPKNIPAKENVAAQNQLKKKIHDQTINLSSSPNELIHRYTAIPQNKVTDHKSSMDSLWKNGTQLQSSSVQNNLISRYKPMLAPQSSQAAMEETNLEFNMTHNDTLPAHSDIKNLQIPYKASDHQNRLKSNYQRNDELQSYNLNSSNPANYSTNLNDYTENNIVKRGNKDAWAMGKNYTFQTPDVFKYSPQKSLESCKQDTHAKENQNQFYQLMPHNATEQHLYSTQQEFALEPNSQLQGMTSNQNIYMIERQHLHNHNREQKEKMTPGYSSFTCHSENENCPQSYSEARHKVSSPFIVQHENQSGNTSNLLNLNTTPQNDQSLKQELKNYTPENKHLNSGRFPNSEDNYHVDIATRENCRLYEAQLELYFGFIGIQAVFVFANFIFLNYAGAVLSLFGLLSAFYSHIDRRCASYLLTGTIFLISAVVLLISVTVGIHGFGAYKDDPTLKAISLGNISLHLIFLVHNLSLAYQHNYRSRDIVPSSCPVAGLDHHRLSHSNTPQVNKFS